MDIYPKKIKALTWKDICTPIFTAALSTITKIWMQPKFFSTNKWVIKIWHLHLYWYIPPSRITALSWQSGLCNSMKLWTMPCKATQDRQIIAESSDKMWSTGGGNGKPPQYTCHENLMNFIKGQKDMTPKDESPRSEGLSSGHTWSWELDGKEGRTPKNWCPRTVVLEKTPESPLDSKEIKPVNLKGYQPWIFAGRTNAKAETPLFWSFDANRQLIGKVPDAEKDWGQKEKTGSRGWASWMASPTQWTWIWANSGK